MQAKNGGWWWIIVALVGLAMAVRTGTNLLRLAKLGGRVTETQKQVEQAKIENQQLQAKLSEVQSPQFVEKEARDKLGYGKEGETIVVIPEELKNPKVVAVDTKSEANWEKWWKLYIWHQ